MNEVLTYSRLHPLLFNSGMFLVLFAGFAAVYWFLRNRTQWRIVWTTLFSIYFYYKTGGWYFALLIVSATSDFFIARGIANSERTNIRKLLVILSLLVNLGMLAYFKYTNLIIEFLNSFSGGDWLAFHNIFLPVGISFFVFQSLSYTIDVYRRQLTPLRSWLDYFFYLSFFPQLVAGPIVRARDFIPQIRRPLRVTRAMFGTGLFLIATGLIKKALISDFVSLNLVDRVFANPMLYTGFENLMAVLGYTLQIYCDFSGYSDMAIGIALLLGFHFPKNFDSPYKSASITEFWRRWHISLSSWLKDYLYISLGGNRKGKVRTYINLIITMLLGGLWHGAGLQFILWGGFHGVALAVHKWFLSRFRSMRVLGSQMTRGRRIAGIAITFLLVSFSWIFFRAHSIGEGWTMLNQIFKNFGTSMMPEIVVASWGVFAMILIGFVLHFIPARTAHRVQWRVIRNPVWLNVALLALVVWVVMQFRTGDIQPFIYFQF